ncbi:MAG: JAB domain-containing protein [Bacillota bacterium]
MGSKSTGKSDGERAAKNKSVQVVRVEMVKERAITFATNRVRNPRDAAVILAEFLVGADREHLVVICLDNKNQINAINVVSVGTLNAALVHPREVFKPAILANAAAVILGHNHPSGDPEPSHEDREIAKRLDEAGRILGVDLLDSIIVGDNGAFVSMKEQGLF